MTKQKEAKLASGKKVTFTPSQKGNSCMYSECESPLVRVEELDHPERMYCYQHCTTQKRDQN